MFVEFMQGQAAYYKIFSDCVMGTQKYSSAKYS